MPAPARRGRPATINDVAAAAGVSRQTVTRAVNDMPGISAATRERVLAAAAGLRYRPSRFGRALVTPQPRTLGLLLEDLGNPYYPELASAVLRSAAAAGWNVVLAERAHAARPEQALRALLSQVDALVAFTRASLPADLDGLGDLPVVEIDRRTGGGAPAGGVVELDRERAIDDAAAHLAAAGVGTAAVFDAVEPSARAASFLARLGERGIDAVRVPALALDLGGGQASTEGLLASGPPPDAVVAFNDAMAFGVLRALRLAGLEVPGQVRVVGVDGLGIGRFVTPRLSTVALDVPAVANAALDLVLALHGGDPGSGPPGHRRVEHRFEVGEST